LRWVLLAITQLVDVLESTTRVVPVLKRSGSETAVDKHLRSQG
jgi:hypothetical protein